MLETKIDTSVLPALRVLNGNRDAWRVSYTPPDRKHYPHVFLWDGAFSAIVRAHYKDSTGAKEEIRAILDGQDPQTGLVPNMIFGPGRHLDLERFTFLHPEHSSNYTQPPLLAHATWEVLQVMDKTPRREFLAEVYPKLARYYDYLGRTRKDSGSSLIAVIHPHETGRDSGPEFDFAKTRLPQPHKGKFMVRGSIDTINSALDYASALQINMKHRVRRWDVNRAREVFWFKDVMFNAIYAQNLEYMGKLADLYGQAEDAAEYGRQSAQVEADILRYMWSEKYQSFHGLDKEGRKYKAITVSNLFPVVLRHTSQEQLASIMQMLEDSNWFGTAYPIPSVPRWSNTYDGSYTEKRLWRGPTWINTNWFIAEGLLQQRDRFKDADPSFAQRLNANALRIAFASKNLIEKSGYREFYNAETGKGLRVDNFAWSTLAHLLIDKIPEMVAFQKDARTGLR